MYSFLLAQVFSSFLVSAIQQIHAAAPVTLKVLENEKWWGGAVVDGNKMPFGDGDYACNLLGDTKGNQGQPLLISNRGRYIWCDDPIRFEFKHGSVSVTAPLHPSVWGQSGSTLRDVYRHVSKTFFPPSGRIPDPLLFTNPQYNTWIELMYDQNEKDILRYAHGILDHGFPPGVLMIDDNWQEDYGTWEFKAEKFQNPGGMVDSLHAMGFKVMLWVCPFVSADSPVYRELAEKRFLITEKNGEKRPAVVRWWNGASALLDLTNADAGQWFLDRLNRLQHVYGVDGFKLDAGDADFYTGPIASSQAVTPNVHSELFCRIGLSFPLNEYRACWKMAGQPLAQRLRDKRHSWGDLRELIPGILAQGLMGYAFTCPDMIGGGEYLSFLNLGAVDQELIVRSAECHALMPMMQFSVAPWRVLSRENLDICRRMAQLHVRLGKTILAMARESATGGEPVARPLEYGYPNQGYAEIKDQWMLGESILVAPVLEKGQSRRLVYFPAGTWHGEDGTVVQGSIRKEIQVPINRLPWYRKN